LLLTLAPMALAAASSAPRVLTLAAAPLHAEPDPSSAVVATAPVDRVGHALAIGTQRRRSTSRDWLGHAMVLVEVAGARGWAEGEHVAVEHRWDDGRAWIGESVGPRNVGGASLWSAGQDGAEWSEKMESWGHAVHEGWLVVEQGGSITRLPWSLSNGWGTSRGADTVVWRDWTGDGVDDAMVVVHETVTEAGSAGRTLELWDFATPQPEQLFSLPVDDPHWNGLATQDQVGWLDIHVDDKRVVKHVLRPGPAPSGRTQGGDGPRLRLHHQVHQFEGGRFVAGAETGGPVPVLLGPEGLRAGPAADAVAIPSRPGTWCIGRTTGPIGIGDAFQAELRPCDGQGAPIGWASSEDLTLLDPVVAEILGPWPDEPGPYVRFDWDRPAAPR
jgi:hypothetical protein